MAFSLKKQLRSGEELESTSVPAGFQATDDRMPKGKKGPPAGFPPKHQPPGAAKAKHKGPQQHPGKQFGKV